MLSLNDPTASALENAVQGQFRLEKEIGRGGMGVVYLATDLQLERAVALKTLPPHLSADPAVRSRFLREARTAAGLSHPSIVPVYHAGERDGVVYFAMGFVDGESLAERVAREGAQEVERMLPILDQLADALGYAHARGVVHRDVKAENVLLDARSGRPLVTDFGIARVTEAQPLTATGTVLGTVHYMSPEQVTGDTLDGRSDLYALGVLAFYAFTGKFPFERPSAPAVLIAHVNSAPPRLHELRPELPGALDEIVARLLAKSPADRFANAESLREALTHARREALPHSERRTPTSEHRAPKTALQPDAPRATPRPEPASRRPAPGLSATEAQQVWARAAELQANTGVHVPPAAFTPRAGDPPTSVYDVTLVRASAVDAGIDARYVDRALAEREALVPAPGSPRSLGARDLDAGAIVVPGDAMSRKPNIFLGALSRLEYESEVAGELDETGFEELADELRRSIGEMVTVSAVGRTLTVTTANTGGSRRGAMPRYLQVHITSRNGRTRVHALENLQQSAGATFGSIVGGVGAGMGGMIMGAVVSATRTPELGFMAWGGAILLGYIGARTLFSRNSKTRARELQSIVERVTRTAAEQIARKEQGRLPRSS